MDMILAVMVYGYGIFLLLLLLLPPPISAQAGNSNGSGSNSSDSSSDGRALMGFKWSSGGSSRGLVSWKKKDPCSGRWIGVRCEEGRVIYLVLRGLNLVGGIDSLTSLDKLQVLILSNNSLNATLPLDMSGWSSSLKLLNLSNNQFSGPVPPSISNLTRLTRLDVSGNRLSGEIPPLASLSRLLALRLQNNQLSGRLASLPSALADLNVSGNELEGAIPASLAKFPVTAFAQNPKLCGPPLSLFCNPLINTTTTTASSPSSPSSMPTPTSSHAQTKSSKQLSVGTIIAIVLGDFAVLLIISIFFALYFWHKYSHPSPPPCSNSNSNSNSNSSSKISKKKKKEQPKIVFSGSGHYSSFLAAETEKGKLVFVVEGLKKRFELEDLLRASAEMLGKGSFGTTYKAVLDDGSAVAVKRLKDSITSQGRREFEQQMEVISRLRHPHLLTLRAYYYSKDEKLLVYEYLPNGNLHSLLHENRGPGRTPLDWTTRIKIALGAARGIAYIHHECKSQRMPHGDIKSSNVLVDKEGNACVSDFGLIMLASPSNAATATILPGYKAPEQAEGKKASQRGDTYSFGVLLLELLTGKSPTPPDRGDGFEVIDLPRWVQSVVREEWTSEVFDLELLRYKNIEEEMVSMLQIAMSCVSESPRLRPRMSQVVKMIYDIIGGAGGDDHSSPHCESFDSTSLSSSLSEGTSH